MGNFSYEAFLPATVRQMTMPMTIPTATITMMSHRLICKGALAGGAEGVGCNADGAGAPGTVGCSSDGASEGVCCTSVGANVTPGCVGCASDGIAGASEGVGSSASSGLAAASLTIKVAERPLTSTA